VVVSMPCACHSFRKITGRVAKAGMCYDKYPCETSWSLQSLTTGAIVAASDFSEVTEYSFRSLSG
jgi:hypothetical protein